MRRKIAVRVGLAVLALVGIIGSTAGACDKFVEPFKDAPRSGVDNARPADVVQMPDGFSNAATKCDHGNRVYVAYHGDRAYASIFVVPQDPTCR